MRADRLQPWKRRTVAITVGLLAYVFAAGAAHAIVSYALSRHITDFHERIRAEFTYGHWIEVVIFIAILSALQLLKHASNWRTSNAVMPRCSAVRA